MHFFFKVFSFEKIKTTALVMVVRYIKFLYSEKPKKFEEITHFSLVLLCNGPFKYYVSMFWAFLGPPNPLRQQKYYWTSAKIAIF